MSNFYRVFGIFTLILSGHLVVNNAFAKSSFIKCQLINCRDINRPTNKNTWCPTDENLRNVTLRLNSFHPSKRYYNWNISDGNIYRSYKINKGHLENRTNNIRGEYSNGYLYPELFMRYKYDLKCHKI